MSMATRSARMCMLLLVLSFSTLAVAQANDEAALLAFKATAIRGSSDDPLASWNRSTGGYCSWEGVRCGGRDRRVVALSLPYHGLIGVLSPAVSNLSSLRILNLSSNRFTGNIPARFGRLHRLHTLDLSYNAFFGVIPANLTSCTNLTIMALNHNQLSGNIPFDLGNKLTRLKLLILWKNNLTGVIPESLTNLSSIYHLSLAFNQLEGTIPPGFGSIQGCWNFDLAYNRLSGKPPVSLYNLSSLDAFQIQGNMLHGVIPADIGSRFPTITFLGLSVNQFTGTIPDSLCNLTTLQVLDLSDNRLTGYMPPTLGRLQALQNLFLWGSNLIGTIPASLSNLTTLQVLDFSSNKLTGYVPRNLGRLQALQGISLQDTRLEADDREGWEFVTSLSNCTGLLNLLIQDNTALTGQMPSSIVNLSRTLIALDMSYTGVSGSIPSFIGNLVNLQYLNVGNTSISGVVPDSIGKLENLVVLALYNSELSGLIPSSIGNLSQLNILFAYSSKLEGRIPASIGNLKNLVALDLSMNSLNGSIPREIFKLTLLSRHLNLSYNSLSGPIPSEVGSLQNLERLYLSGNQLSGEIPDSIGNCIVLQVLQLDSNSFEGSIPKSIDNLKGLLALNMSINKLSGTIPEGIGSISNLELLCLAHNSLSGSIPTILQNLTFLSALDLSFNNLQGKVPTEGIFKNLANFTISGNSDLCGGIPQLHLDPCHTDLVKKHIKGSLLSLKIALSIIGPLFSLAIIIVLFQLINRKIRQNKKSSLPLIIEDQYERVSYHTLSYGTDGFSESNLLGKGSFGAVYKCTFQDEETIVAVKVFNLEQSGSNRSFVAECEALKRARHRCLIKIITCCSSFNHQGQEFKALIFEFMPNGSLNGWLHSEPRTPTINNTLSLEQRLDIAVDIMGALDYLHNHCQPPIVHCDLKPSNILLAEDMSARVGDFGISRIITESASKALQNSNSTMGIRGSIGYIAPEYGEGSSVSTHGDVYSLGILLLEIFTGRSPTDVMFRGPLDLHEFSKDALPERIWDIADITMWLHTDANDSTTRTRINNCLVSVIALGISCSKKQPKERTLMHDAAVEMQAIRDSYFKFARSLELEHQGVTTTRSADNIE